MPNGICEFDESVARPEKDRLRARLVDLVYTQTLHRPAISVLSLPGLTWNFERALITRLRKEGKGRQYPSTVLGCESHPDRSLAVSITRPAHATFHDGDIADCMEAPTRWDAIWLDFCAPLSNSIESAIAMGARSARHVLAITLQSAREMDIPLSGHFDRAIYMLKLLADLVPQRAYPKWSPAFMEFYKDSKTPMMMFVLKRGRTKKGMFG